MPATKSKPIKKAETPRNRFAKYRERSMDVSVSPELKKLSKEYFPQTRYKSASGFFEAMLIKFFVANAAQVRKSGRRLPSWIFDK